MSTVTSAEAAVQIGCLREYVSALIKRGLLVGRRENRRWSITTESLGDYLDARQRRGSRTGLLLPVGVVTASQIRLMATISADKVASLAARGVFPVACWRGPRPLYARADVDRWLREREQVHAVFASPAEAARMLGISRQAVHQGIKAGRIPSARKTGMACVPRDWIAETVARRGVKP